VDGFRVAGRRSADGDGRWGLYLEGLNVLNHNNPFFVDANVVDLGSGTPRLQEDPVAGFPHLVTFGVRFRFP
jgi:hypothetical protein